MLEGGGGGGDVVEETDTRNITQLTKLIIGQRNLTFGTLRSQALESKWQKQQKYAIISSMYVHTYTPHNYQHFRAVWTCTVSTVCTTVTLLVIKAAFRIKSYVKMKEKVEDAWGEEMGEVSRWGGMGRWREMDGDGGRWEGDGGDGGR